MVEPLIVTPGSSPLKNVALFIPSCDAYSDLWQPFFTLLQRHWSDCPCPVYLGANQQVFKSKELRVLRSDKGIVWADRTLDHLRQVREEHVIMWLEDFFLRRPVDTVLIENVYADFCRLDAHMLRLVRRPGPDVMEKGQIFGPVFPGSLFRVSTQAAIWKKETLVRLIKEGESIWQFEMLGSARSDVYTQGFYAVANDVVPYRHHVVERGKWFPWEAWNFGRQNIGCDFSRRPVMSFLEATWWLARKGTSLFLAMLPSAAVRVIMSVGRFLFRRHRDKKGAH